MYAASPDEYYEASQVESKLMSKARKAHELPAFYYFTTVGQSECTPIQYQRIIKSSWVVQRFASSKPLTYAALPYAANVCGLKLLMHAALSSQYTMPLELLTTWWGQKSGQKLLRIWADQAPAAPPPHVIAYLTTSYEIWKTRGSRWKRALKESLKESLKEA